MEQLTGCEAGCKTRHGAVQGRPLRISKDREGCGSADPDGTRRRHGAGPRVEVDKLLVTLNEDFTTVDLGELSFFTGCAVIQDIENRVTKINQKTFIETF